MTALSYATYAGVKARLGEPDDTNQTLLTSIVTQMNDWLEGEIGRAIGPLDAQTYTFDGYEAFDGGRALHIRQGIRSITTLTVAPTTGATAVSVTATDVVILPRSQNLPVGWPGDEIRFIDNPTGPVVTFSPGYGNIVAVGNFGWAAIPSELTMVAEVAIVRAWRAKASGQADVVGTNEFGAPIVSKFIAPEHWRIIRRYRPEGIVVG